LAKDRHRGGRRRVWGIGLAAAIAVLAATPAAQAHAILLQTTPPNGVVLKRTPVEVRLRFNEHVETEFGSVRVYDEGAHRVDDGKTTRPTAEEVAVGLPARLPNGTYTVTWRVISADTHPVHGAFVFSIGRSTGTGVITQVLDAQAGSKTVDVATNIARFASFALLLVVVGGIAMLAGPLRTGPRQPLWLVLAAAGGLLALVSLVGIGLEGPQAAGLGLGAAFKTSLLREILHTQFGKVWTTRGLIALAVAIVAVLVRIRIVRDATIVMIGLLVAAAALAVTPGLAGHANVEPWYALASDATHVAAASLWLGGLVFLLLSLLWTSGGRWAFAATAVPRYSTVAVLAVAALVGSGVINSIIELGPISGLWTTTWGELLLAKVGLVLIALALGAFNNRFSVPQLRSSAATELGRRQFVWRVGAEIAILLVVVGVTAVLVAERPAKAASSGGPVSVDTRIGPYDLNVVVDPARTGGNAVHLYILNRTTGQPAEVAEAKISASLSSASIGPLRFTSTKAGPGHYIASGATFPIPGAWTLRVDVRRGEFDEWSTVVQTPIRKA
jgi:copper transport protein